MEFIYLVSICWFWVSFEPLHYIIDKIFLIFVLNSSGYVRGVFDFIHNSLSCPECVGFWLTLSITGNFYKAVFVSLLHSILHLCLQKLK